VLVILFLSAIGSLGCVCESQYWRIILSCARSNGNWLAFWHSPVSYVTRNFGKPVSLLVSAYSSTLKMEVTCSSETSVHFQRTSWRYNPKHRTLHAPCHLSRWMLVLLILRPWKQKQYVLPKRRFTLTDYTAPYPRIWNFS
jgi:hypothetical protein